MEIITIKYVHPFSRKTCRYMLAYYNLYIDQITYSDIDNFSQKV